MRLRWNAPAVLFAAGMAGMACQVAWTRAFALVLGSSTYSFTVILVTFLSGLSLGALAFRALRGRFTPRMSGLGLLLGCIGLAVLAGLPAFNRLPYLVMRAFRFTPPGGWRLHAVNLALAAGVMGIPTALMGAVLPWAVAALKPRRESMGSAAGSCYAANTLGAIAGCALAALFLLPLWGAERTLAAAAWLYGAAAGLLLLSSGPAWIAAALAAALLAAQLLPAPWDPRVLSSGMFLYGGLYKDNPDFKSFLADLHRDKVLFSRDGRTSSVCVLESAAGERYLRVNGKTDASSGGDLDTQLLLGYLPALLHRGSPRRAMLIGLGSGATAAAILSEPGISRLDLAEIEPAVVSAAAFFEDANRKVLRDPRLHVVTADGRQLLASPGPRYDLITSEPSNPWIAGVSSLYTAEAFESAKGRLADDGVFLQWFHSYLMGKDDFKLIMRTFSSVFPHTMLLWSGEADFFLAGSNSPWEISFPKVERAFAKNPFLRRDLGSPDKGYDEPLTLLAATFLLDDAEVRRMSEGSPVHRDDRPSLEFSAPRHLRVGETEEIVREIIALKAGILPEGLRGFSPRARDKATLYEMSGEILLASGAPKKAGEAFEKALGLDPRSARARTDMGHLAQDAGRLEEARRLYLRAAALDPGYAPAHLRLGILRMIQRRDEEGIPELEKGLRLFPADPEGSLYLSVAYLEKGKTEAALNVLRAALARPITEQRLREELLEALGIARQQAAGKPNGPRS